MKRLLVVRIPASVPVERAEAIADQIRRKAGDDFIVLVFGDKVEKTEVEIIYDPNLKSTQTGYQLDGSLDPDTEKKISQGMAREFLQVDTSTNAYMGGKEMDFERVNSSDLK